MLFMAGARDLDLGAGFALFAIELCFCVFPRGSDFAVRILASSSPL